MSRTGPCSMMRPAYITATRSHILATTPKSCVMKMIARFVCSCSSRKSRRYCAWIVASTADVSHLALRLIEQIFALETDHAVDDPRHRSRLEPQQGQRRHRLAAAGLAHDTERLAFPDREADAVDGLHHAPPREAVGVE